MNSRQYPLTVVDIAASAASRTTLAGALPIGESWLASGRVSLPASYSSRPNEFLGHSDLATKMIYTHVLDRGAGAVRSPLESPDGASDAMKGGVFGVDRDLSQRPGIDPE
jgi:hypothetical protein